MTDHPEYLALLHGVIDHPDDDLRRLVIADWLDENGQSESAEFIRVQIELASVGPCHWGLPATCMAGSKATCWPCERRHILTRRERELRGAMYEIGSYATFERGFVARWTGPLQVWLDHGPAIVRQHPIDRVVATDRTPRLSLAEAPGKFLWFNLMGGTFSDTEDLPDKVWVKLTRCRRIESWKVYDTEALALDGLSAALITLARGKSG